MDCSSEARDMSWLCRLPKAELHCHLGGCQDARVLKELASLLLQEIRAETLSEYTKKIEKVLGCPLQKTSHVTMRDYYLDNRGEEPVHCLNALECISEQTGIPRRYTAAVMVDSLEEFDINLLSRDGRLDSDGKIIWPSDDEVTGGNRLEWYMACGNLGGSTMLQTEATLRAAVKSLVNEAAARNVRYLEIRCSPGNYTEAGLSAEQALDILINEAERLSDPSNMLINFLVMATRHAPAERMSDNVKLAIKKFRQRVSGASGVVGFDLAGQEENNPPENFIEQFEPLHRNFMNITIHAGEMAEDDKIWQAIYRLHAKRIGHGLKLINNRRMMDFVRDHGLAVEMCPSSNSQTNSFRDFCSRCSSECPEYPLADYLRHGILVTVNTDNSFISATDPAREYWQASVMTRGGLNRWDILKLVKNSFKAVFLPKDEKDQLLKRVDNEIFDLLLQEYM